MNMPGFNADATLYKTSGHYQTSRNMINLPTQMGSAIYAAMMEQIDIHGCAPGSTLWPIAVGVAVAVEHLRNLKPRVTIAVRRRAWKFLVRLVYGTR